MQKLLPFLLVILVCGCDSLKSNDIIFNDLTVYAPRTGSRVTAGFTNITNKSAEAITITSISSPQFNIVEIHETAIKNGVARMMKIETLIIPEYQSVALKPGGKHLMLIDPKMSSAEGEEINLIIKLSSNEILTLSTPAVSRF